MATKRIPYQDNVGVLRSIEKKCPRNIEFLEIRDNFKKNYLFHESCHAVARNVLSGVKVCKLKLLLEESFANSCELFGMLDAEDAAHRIFYEWNSYTSLFEMRSNLKVASKEIGKVVLFQFFMMGYLHANFLFSSFSEKEFLAVQSLIAEANSVEFSAQQLKTIRALLKVCFTLDFDFRSTTTGLHMKLSGVRDAGTQDFGYFGELLKGASYSSAILHLTLIALGEADPAKNAFP